MYPAVAFDVMNDVMFDVPVAVMNAVNFLNLK